MNILFITLGTSDVQINSNPGHGFSVTNNILQKEGLPEIALRYNRNYDNLYLLKSPRNDGKSILESYEQFDPILQFPLIEPVIRLLLEKNPQLHEVWLVFTDQTNAESHFKNNDTLFFSEIIKRKLKPILPNTNFVDLCIRDNVRDIDKLYIGFYKQALKLSERKYEIKKIYLLPQGGIDQINQALTLQLIQLFKDRVSLYQKAEQAEPSELTFPHLFLNDLTKQTVIKHLKDFDFDKASDLILDSEELQMLCQYAAMRLSLFQERINLDGIPEKYQLDWQKLSKFEKDKIKLQDLTYSFKIQMRQKHFNEALTKLFTITENIYKVPLNCYLQEDLFNYFDKDLNDPNSKNEKWEKFIEEKICSGYIEKLKKKKTYLNNPNRKALFYLFRWLKEKGKIHSSITDEEIKKFYSFINDLRDMRNEVAHRLGSVTKEDLNKIYEKNKINPDFFYSCLDKIIGTDGMGIYEQIQKKILSHYGENL